VEAILHPTPPSSTRLHYAWALAHAWEYVRIVHALAPNTPATPFDKTTVVLHLLHPLVEVDFTPFIDDFHPEMEVTLNWETFIYVLVHSPRLSFSGPLGVVYELLWDVLSQMILQVASTFFQGMWAHFLKSCSTFNIAFSFYISTLSIEKMVWMHMSHFNRWSDLSLNCLHISYSV